MSNNGNQVLNSWKEIASYLQVSVRTAQLWEAQRGLPVRRVPGGRGVVWADPAELDAWRKPPPTVAPAAAPKAAPAAAPIAVSVGPVTPSTLRLAILSGITIAVACVALAGWVIVSHSAQPNNTMPGDRPDDTGRSIPLATSPGDEWEATFSPDGAQVAYIWNGDSGREPRNLYLKSVAGGPPRRLTNGAWVDQFPRWSPDGQWIALGRLKDTTVEILLISPDGVRQRTLERMESPAYRDSTAVQWVSWHPNSKSLAVIQRPSLGDPFSIFQLSLEDGQRKQLTFPPPEIIGDLQCAFSPDGRYLAFARYRDGALSDLYLSPLDGGEPQPLTHDRIYHSGLAWSPDSREVIYGAQRQSQSWGLWRLEAHPSGQSSPRRIAGVQEDASWPTVAPAPAGEGIRIAYTHSRSTVNIQRWDRAQMQHSPPRAICPSTRSDKAVQYSPDGSRIAFVSTREGSREIWVCDADGSRPTKITSVAGEYTDSPRWSPDGQRLAFTTSFDENRDVWIADLRTAQSRRLTHEPSHEGRASWSSDGHWIYFRSNRSGQDEIWKMPAEGGEAIQITTTGAYEPFESLDGSRLYFCKDRARRGVWSVPTTGGEETFVAENVRDGLWSVARDGIYFLAEGEIRMHRFSTAKTESLARIPDPGAIWTGFSARADGLSFLWCQTTRKENDIMMLELPELRISRNYHPPGYNQITPTGSTP